MMSTGTLQCGLPSCENIRGTRACGMVVSRGKQIVTVRLAVGSSIYYIADLTVHCHTFVFLINYKAYLRFRNVTVKPI